MQAFRAGIVNEVAKALVAGRNEAIKAKRPGKEINLRAQFSPSFRPQHFNLMFRQQTYVLSVVKEVEVLFCVHNFIVFIFYLRDIRFVFIAKVFVDLH